MIVLVKVAVSLLIHRIWDDALYKCWESGNPEKTAAAQINNLVFFV